MVVSENFDFNKSGFNTSAEQKVMKSKLQKRGERTNCGSEKSTCSCQTELAANRMVVFLLDCEFDVSKSLLRIDNIAESEVALTKLTLVEDMTIYIGNTKLEKVLDLTSAHFRPVRELHLILENNPYLNLDSLSLDGKWSVEVYYSVFEIRGRGLNSFHENILSHDLVLRNLPERFDPLENCDYISAGGITIVGSLPSACHLHPLSSPLTYSLINVHTISGKRVLDPKVFCQSNTNHEGTSIVNSEVILPESCLSRTGPLQVIQIDLWNLQKNCIVEISCVTIINGFDIPFMQADELDRAWRSRSPDDCKHFCFGADRVLENCDRNKRNQAKFLCAFCLRNKFGEPGDKYIRNVCDYQGPMTLEDKMQAENDKNKEIEDEDNINNDTGGQASRPSHFTQLRVSYAKLFVTLMLNLKFEL